MIVFFLLSVSIDTYDKSGGIKQIAYNLIDATLKLTVHTGGPSTSDEGSTWCSCQHGGGPTGDEEWFTSKLKKNRTGKGYQFT